MKALAPRTFMVFPHEGKTAVEVDGVVHVIDLVVAETPTEGAKAALDALGLVVPDGHRVVPTRSKAVFAVIPPAFVAVAGRRVPLGWRFTGLRPTEPGAEATGDEPVAIRVEECEAWDEERWRARVNLPIGALVALPVAGTWRVGIVAPDHARRTDGVWLR